MLHKADAMTEKSKLGGVWAEVNRTCTIMLALDDRVCLTWLDDSWPAIELSLVPVPSISYMVSSLPASRRDFGS
jgi:hypothetical protein